MRKIFLSIFCALALTACADDDRPITFEQLPQAAQALLTQYVDPTTILLVTQDGVSMWADYDVLTNDRQEWGFNSDGSLESVKIYTGVPDALVPEVVRAYIQKMYPDAVIIKYSIDFRDQEVELNNRIELKFDLKGRLLEAEID